MKGVGSHMGARVSVAGASGYAGGELLRLLADHPDLDIGPVTAQGSAGASVTALHPQLSGHPGLRDSVFVPADPALLSDADLVFMALPHGESARLAAALPAALKVIDLSADFRLKSAALYKDFYEREHPAPELLAQAVYGLPEVYRERIKSASLIASPGCYPTGILLPAIPLLRAGLVRADGIIADSLSGVSGAGRKAEPDYLFVECNESLRPYGLPKHRHLSEIEQELSLTTVKG